MSVQPPAVAPAPPPSDSASTSVGVPSAAEVENVATPTVDEPAVEPAAALAQAAPAEPTEDVLAAAAEADDRFSALDAQQAEVARGFQLAELEAYRQPFDLLAAEDADAPALEAEETALLDELTVDLSEGAAPEDVDISAVRQKRLESTQSELPLVLRDDVVRLVKYFTGRRGSRTLRATLGRSGAYREMIERVLEEEDVPLELFHLAQAESGFVPKARSYARATGMWQFMSFRGKQYGLRQDRYLEERYDAEKATRAAARHLKDLHIEFGDWYLAMAAYNAGPRRVENAIKRGGTRDYWELCRRRLLPRQTRNYVPIILAMAYVSKNLDVYDVGVIDYAPPRRYDTVTTDSEITFDLIADLTGSSITELEDLNPALLRSATPPYAYDLRIPADSADRFRTEIALIPRGQAAAVAAAPSIGRRVARGGRQEVPRLGRAARRAQQPRRRFARGRPTADRPDYNQVAPLPHLRFRRGPARARYGTLPNRPRRHAGRHRSTLRCRRQPTAELERSVQQFDPRRPLPDRAARRRRRRIDLGFGVG